MSNLKNDSLRFPSNRSVAQIKKDAKQLVDSLKSQKLTCHMLTGDASDAGQKIAKQLKLNSVQSGCSTQDKQTAVEQWDSQNEVDA